MKKTVSVILAALAAVSLFTSCSKEAEPENKETTAQAEEIISATASEKKADAVNDIKGKIRLSYINTLKENIYDYSSATEYKELPQYTLYDFDKDDIPELLIWDIKIADAQPRTITVYKYRSESGNTEPVGTMTDFEGHSVLGESADGTGVILAVRDSDEDKITKYTLQNGALVSEVILKRNGESDTQWINIMSDSDYLGSFEFEISNGLDPIYKVFGLSADSLS